MRYEGTVRRALNVHWERLDAAARDALLVAACFAAEDASIALLEACGVDANTRHPLRRFHLITDEGERWRMHRLVREWARGAAPPEDLARARRRFIEGCVEFSRGITLQEGYRIYRVDGPHLEEAVRDAEAILSAADPRVSELLDRVAIALQSLGVLPRAKELLELALESNLKNLGEDHSTVATSRSNLAMVLQDLGELPRAKELLELALESNLKKCGEDHLSVAILRTNLGSVLQDLGELKRAQELLELALESDLKNLVEDHPEVARSRSNLAVVLRNLRELARAKELLELALESDLKNLGEDHPSVATRRFNLATIARDTDDLARARELFALTLAGEECSLGADHPSTAYTRASLARVLHQMGETEPARAEAERALRAVASQPKGSQFRTRVEQIAKQVLSER